MSRILSALTLSLLATGCAARQAPDTGVGTQPAPIHQWTSGEAGFHTNSWWLDTGEEVVVFDAQFTPALAEALITDIQAATDSPITTLVVTHPNPDKFNGASAFQALGAQVIASDATAEAMAGVHDYKEAYFTGVGMFEPGAYPALPEVDRRFGSTLSLELQGSDTPLVLSVLEHGGVASSQTVAVYGDHVFVGDLVATQTHAWLEGGIVDGVASPDLESWDLALAELLSEVGPQALVHPGRGPSMPAGESLPAQRAYLEEAEAVVRAVLAEQDEPAQALSGDDAAEVYGEITRRMEAAYPDHAHSYLVSYGVYGLAWSLVDEG